MLAKFDASKFANPMEGLSDLRDFATIDLTSTIHTNNNGFWIETVTNLVANENITWFVKDRHILGVPLGEAMKTARPAAMVLLTGAMYRQLVTSICSRGDKFEYSFQILEVLSYIHELDIWESTKSRTLQPDDLLPYGNATTSKLTTEFIRWSQCQPRWNQSGWYSKVLQVKIQISAYSLSTTNKTLDV